MKKPGFWSKNNFLYSQIAALLLLNLFAGVTFCAKLFADQSLYWDNLKLFSFFRDNLHALNYFGEIAWWNPTIQHGFPIYYTSVLGVNCTSPLFVLAGVIAYMLGKVGITITAYHALYVCYFGFVIPCAFNLGLLLLARQIFKKAAAMFFVIALGAFSPGVIFNLSDNGLEHTAYGLLFAGMYVKFLKHPQRKTFWGMIAAAAILGISLNHLFLYWNILFIPLFIVVSHLFSPLGFTASVKRMMASMPLMQWLIAGLLVLVCILPAMIAFADGSDILRATLGSRTYSYWGLDLGNPLEMLTASTPGIGFEWSVPYFSPQRIEHGKSLGYLYLGLLTLPLAIVGALFGQRAWRMRFGLLTIIASIMISMSGYSPLFGAILMLPSPLRAVRHFADTTFRNGMFFLLILLAGLGVEILLRRPHLVRRIFLPCFLASSTISMLLFAHLYGEKTVQHPIFGFALALIAFFTVALLWYSRAKSERRKREILIILLILTFADVSTVAFWHVRMVIYPQAEKITEPGVTSIGCGNSSINHWAQNLLLLRQVKELELTGANLASLPPLALYADLNRVLTQNETLRKQLPPLLSVEDMQDAALAAVINRQPLQGGTIAVTGQTYNTLSLKITAPETTLLFWRDAYFPYWRALVNGSETQIIPAFGAFKTILVPQGASEVTFSFSPGSLPLSLFAAYFVILASCAIKITIRIEH